MKNIFFLLTFSFIFFTSWADSHSESSQLYQESELHQYIRNRDVNGVEKLLPSEPDLYVRNSRGQTPLTLAVLLSERDIATLLLDKGAKLDLKDSVDQVALEYANRSVKKLLKKYGQTGSFCQRIFRR